MRHGTRADAAQVPVRLTTEEIADRGESMATKLLHINALRASRLDAMQKSQKLIDNELDELGRLARVVMDSSELRRQGDLFHQPGITQATEVLAEVAKIAAATTLGDHEAAVPVLTEIPERCPLCQADVRGIGGADYTCANTECPWVAHVIVPGSIDAQRAADGLAPLPASGIEAAPEESAADRIKRQRREKRAARLAQVGAEPEADEASA